MIIERAMKRNKKLRQNAEQNIITNLKYLREQEVVLRQKE